MFDIFKSKPEFALFFEFRKPPWGGGNQFLLGLKKELKNKGYKVLENKISKRTSICLFNSFNFDFEHLKKYSRNTTCTMIHRVDGPVQLYRGKDVSVDDELFQINNDLADCTVFQSQWSMHKTLGLGYKPVNPVIISNTVDPAIFHKNGRISFSNTRKIRLISTSWSDNPKKGGKTYKWIEENLDWDRFEYTFVGRSQVEFDKIKCIDPVPSGELAGILRQHDIYVTASQNDPCSNALIEALACGLPALYLNDGGHPELVGNGGIPFERQDEIFSHLERLVENYEMFQKLIVISSIEKVADKYLALTGNT